MASVLDSIKTTIGDSHPFFKVAVLSFLVFAVMQMYTSTAAAQVVKTSVIAVTFLILLGFAVLTVHNSINENTVLMPSLNPFALIWAGVNGFLALFPYILLIYFGINWVNGFLIFEPWVNILILIASSALLIAFFAVALVLYAKKLNLLAGYNVVNIVKYVGDFIVYSFVLAFGLFLFVVLVFVPTGFVVKLMFDFGLVFDYFVIFSIILLINVMLQYYSQLFFEFVDLDDK